MTRSDVPEVAVFCRRMYPALVGALTLHTGDSDVAEEVAQEALARAWERWSRVRTMDSPEAWVFRVAMNLATSRFRRVAAERRARERLTSGLRDQQSDETDRLAVQQAVLSLPPRQRMALLLRYYADLTVDDVAVAMRCAPGTVKSLTSKAIEGLRSRIADVEEVADRA